MVLQINIPAPKYIIGDTVRVKNGETGIITKQAELTQHEMWIGGRIVSYIIDYEYTVMVENKLYAYTEEEITHIEKRRNKMETLWLADWEEAGFKGMKLDFEIKGDEYDDINVIVGYYNYENWEGDALVIYEHKDKLFTVNGSHCSCYGLEGQWDPEEITIEYLKHKIEKGSFAWNSDNDKEIKEHLKEYIRSIEK